ncbi:CX3C chemokine receptor 1-like [Tubulanus polymorphus]|uniref:CX3C chemokine receptor 1-like n=1 Tax=Tubulanus polymorphus TaxID=672921 RepID=UPI003DA58BE2
MSNLSDQYLPTFWCNFLQNGYNQLPPAGRWYILVYFPIAILVGLIGNTLSVLVMTTSKKLRSCGYSGILVVLVCSDSVALLERIPVWINFIAEHTGHGRVIDLNTNAKCLSVELFTVSTFSGAWLVSFISIERFLVVCIENCSKRFCTTRNMFVCSLVLVLMAIIVDLSLMYSVKFVESVGFCAITLRSHYIYIRIASMLASPLPLFIILLFNGITLCYMKAKTIKLKTHREVGAAVNNRTNRATLMLLAVSFTFALTTLPYFCVLIAIAANKGKKDSYETHMLVTRALYDLNYTLNFALYCAAGSDFRHACLRFLQNCRAICSGNQASANQENSATASTSDSKL